MCYFKVYPKQQELSFPTARWYKPLARKVAGDTHSFNECKVFYLRGFIWQQMMHTNMLFRFSNRVALMPGTELTEGGPFIYVSKLLWRRNTLITRNSSHLLPSDPLFLSFVLLWIWTLFCFINHEPLWPSVRSPEVDHFNSASRIFFKKARDPETSEPVTARWTCADQPGPRHL